MASISTDKSGKRRILYFDENRNRRILYIGNKISEHKAEGVQHASRIIPMQRSIGNAIDRDDSTWPRFLQSIRACK